MRRPTLTVGSSRAWRRTSFEKRQAKPHYPVPLRAFDQLEVGQVEGKRRALFALRRNQLHSLPVGNSRLPLHFQSLCVPMIGSQMRTHPTRCRRWQEMAMPQNALRFVFRLFLACRILREKNFAFAPPARTRRRNQKIWAQIHHKFKRIPLRLTCHRSGNGFPVRVK
jgi:hypothetical protein